MIIKINSTTTLNLHNVTTIAPEARIVHLCSGHSITLTQDEMAQLATFLVTIVRQLPQLFILREFLFNMDHVERIQYYNAEDGAAVAARLWFTDHTYRDLRGQDVSDLTRLLTSRAHIDPPRSDLNLWLPS